MSVNFAHREVGAFPVTDRARFAERRGHQVSVRGGVLPVVTTQARRRCGPERREEFSRSLRIGHAG